MFRSTLLASVLGLCVAGCSIPGGTAGFSVSVTMPPTAINSTPLNIDATTTPAPHKVTVSAVPYAMPQAAPASPNGIRLESVRPMPCPE